MVTVNLYELLGISPDATTEEIEAGYLNALEVHKEELAAEPKGRLWCLIQIAHDNLLDDKKRAAHDVNLNGVQAPVPASHPAPDSTPEAFSYATPNHQAVSHPGIRPGSVPPVPPLHAPSVVTSPSEEPDKEEDYLKHIAKPVINWDALPWMHANYSRFKETLAVRNPGLSKGMWSFFGFGLAVFLSGVYASTFKFEPFKGFPVPVFLAVVVAVFWVRYLKFEWRNKKFYLASMAAFSVATLASILFGKNSGTSAPFLAVVFAGICLLAGYLGLVAAKNGRIWMDINSFRQALRFRGNRISDKEIKNNRIWGNVGDLSDATDIFGARNVALGQAGEQFTAELMEQLLRIPGTRIFHGLQYPGSLNADVDHAIVNGDKIVFVDSKLWKAGNYSWLWDGVILRKNGEEETKIDTSFHHAIETFHRKMAGVQIRSNILIHSASGKPVNIDNSNSEKSHGDGPETRMVTAQQFLAETGEWFSEGKPGYLNKFALKYLHSNLKP